MFVLLSHTTKYYCLNRPIEQRSNSFIGSNRCFIDDDDDDDDDENFVCHDFFFF